MPKNEKSCRAKKLILGQTRERLCEAEKQCNAYYICYDANDRPTDRCALNFCELYVEENKENESDRSLRAQVLEVINNFSSYNDNEDEDMDKDDEEDSNLTNLDDLLRILQSLWYNIQEDSKFTDIEKRCLEMAVRILEIVNV